MKLISILLFKWDVEKPILLSSHIDVSFINFFMRDPVKEHILFHSRLVCSRTPLNVRQSVKMEQNLGFCHAYSHPSGLAATVLCDAEYPSRVAFSLINQILKAFYEVRSSVSTGKIGWHLTHGSIWFDLRTIVTSPSERSFDSASLTLETLPCMGIL